MATGSANTEAWVTVLTGLDAVMLWLFGGTEGKYGANLASSATKQKLIWGPF